LTNGLVCFVEIELFEQRLQSNLIVQTAIQSQVGESGVGLQGGQVSGFGIANFVARSLAPFSPMSRKQRTNLMRLKSLLRKRWLISAAILV
jgi:hypothetical protein